MPDPARPAGGAYRFTIRAALSSARASHDTRPPRDTARNTRPVLISAAASHVCTASTGRSLASGNRHLLPLPFLTALAAPDQDPQSVGDLGEIDDLEHESSLRRNAPAKPRHSSPRSRLPIMLSGHSAIIWPIRSAVAGALPCLADPMVRRMPRRTAFTASLPVGGSWPAILPMAAALRPMVLALRPLSARLER